MPRPRIIGDWEVYTLRGLGPPQATMRPDILIEGKIGTLPAEQPIPDSARRTLRQNQRLAERERAAAAAHAIKPKVQTAFKPPRGKLWGVDEVGLMIVGPAGGIGTTAIIARVLAPLAAGGRHEESAVAAATGCRDVEHLREMLAGIAGKLAAVGLRVDRRKAGIRIAKAKPAASPSTVPQNTP